MKKIISIITLIAIIFVFNNCTKNDPLGIFDSLEAIECVNQIQKIEENDDLTCEELINELNKIENSCGEFLSESSKADIAVLRTNCMDN